jgi:hypothetical protein
MATKKKKDGPCHECKKKELMTELPPVIQVDEFFIPTYDDIRLAYTELGSKDIEPKKEFINKVYSAIFNETFDFGCRACVNAQSRKLKNFIETVLNIKL